MLQGGLAGLKKNILRYQKIRKTGEVLKNISGYFFTDEVHTKTILIPDYFLYTHLIVSEFSDIFIIFGTHVDFMLLFETPSHGENWN